MEFSFDLSNMTIGDWITLDDPKSIRELRTLMAKFMADEHGQLLGVDKATKLIDSLSHAELPKLLRAFRKQWGELKAEAISPLPDKD